MRGARALIDLLAPPRCLGCGGLSAGLDLGLCRLCRLRLAPPVAGDRRIDGLDSWLAATDYRGPARRVVAALKRGSVPAAAGTAAELIAEALGPIEQRSVLVPVGPAPRRSLSRGLDPAEEIALALGERLGLPVARILRRRDQRRQRGRSREQRLLQPPRYRVAGGAPELALLVDDVLTTGGTLCSCARALRGAGSMSVQALVFARVPGPGGEKSRQPT